MNSDASVHRVGWYDSEAFDAHGTVGHPERPERLVAIRKRLTESGLSQRLVRIDAPRVDPSWPAVVHSAEYLDRLRKSLAAGSDALDAELLLAIRSPS